MNKSNQEENDTLVAKTKKEANTKKIFATVSSIIAGIAAAMTLGLGTGLLTGELWNRPPKLTSPILTELHQIEVRLSQQEDITQTIFKNLESSSMIEESTKTGAQTTLILSKFEELNSRIKTLEDGFLENPQKALLIPLLRNDLDNFKQTYKEDITAIDKSIDRVYDQNKWFIGLMFTMAIGLIGLAINNLVQARKKK
jgi:hypothetical protein